MAKGINAAELKRVYDIALRNKPKKLPNVFGRTATGNVFDQWRKTVMEEAGVTEDRANTAIANAIRQYFQ